MSKIGADEHRGEAMSHVNIEQTAAELEIDLLGDLRICSQRRLDVGALAMIC